MCSMLQTRLQWHFWKLWEMFSTAFSTARWKTRSGPEKMLNCECPIMRKFCCILLVSCGAAYAQNAEGKLAPYYPTPETIVMKMLQLGGLKAGEKMFDL